MGMFKKSSPSEQLNMSTLPNALFSGNSLKMHENTAAWHNQFRKQLTSKGQSADFVVSGKRIRMDSKLLESSIAWLSRYELIHETLRLFYKEPKLDSRIDKAARDRLDRMLRLNVTESCGENSPLNFSSGG
jgi:hypothetical protein